MLQRLTDGCMPLGNSSCCYILILLRASDIHLSFSLGPYLWVKHLEITGFPTQFFRQISSIDIDR
jgi:hypothetical protein